jgi:hypothetical protein
MKTVQSAALAAIVLHAFFNPCQAQDAAAEVAKVAEQYDAALLKNDSAFLDRLFDEAGMFIDHEGKVFNKKEYRALPAVAYETGKSLDRSFRIVGPLVIETGVWEGTGKLDGKAVSYRHRYCDVWIKKDGRWVITFEQSTPHTDALAEMKKFAPWVGSWNVVADGKYFSDVKREFTGKLTIRMILDGAFLEERFELQDKNGKVEKGIILTGYDAETKTFFEHSYFGNGVATKASATVDGKSRGMSATEKNAEGKIERSRGTLAEDGKTSTGVWEEFHEDTKSWVPWFKTKASKVGN